MDDLFALRCDPRNLDAYVKGYTTYQVVKNCLNFAQKVFLLYKYNNQSIPRKKDSNEKVYNSAFQGRFPDLI